MNNFETLGDAAKRVLTGLLGERPWDGKPIAANGVYAGVPIETYHRDPALFGGGFSISSSGLRTLLRRPAEYWWTSPYNPKAEEPEAKQALDFGKAAHMLLLGEHGFAEQYALRPEKYEDEKGASKPWNANSNACKEWLQKQATAGKTVITETEIGHIRHMAAALQHKEPVRLGILKGRIERSIFLLSNNIWVKARPDVVPNASGDYVDLKTAASVDDESLSRAIYANGYHVQAGLLRMIVREVLGADAFASFTFVFVEKAPPYDVRVMQLKDSDIDLGERQARYGLKVLRDCLKHKAWPGYDGFDREISYVEMPSWSRTRIETQLAAEAA